MAGPNRRVVSCLVMASRVTAQQTSRRRGTRCWRVESRPAVTEAGRTASLYVVRASIRRRLVQKWSSNRDAADRVRSLSPSKDRCPRTNGPTLQTRKKDCKKVSLDGAATRTSSRESLTVPRALCNKNRQLERPSCAVKPAWSDARIQLDPAPSACAGERSKTACSCTDARGLICGEPRTVIP